MSMTDSIADMLTRIRNGQKSKLMSITFPCAKIKCAILRVLKEEGYIKDYETFYDKNILQIEVYLKYSIKGKGAICKIDRVSKPGKRVSLSINKLKGYYNNMGVYILTTSKGVLSDKESHSQNVGGEIICKVF